MVLNLNQFKILNGVVMHHRHIPAENQFLYPLFYIHVPLSTLSQRINAFLFGMNSPAILSFYTKDHGSKDKTITEWIDHILSPINPMPTNIDRDKISLITLPRIFGFVFNPVSFWLCPDQDDQLRAVICEVNNTFGERHIYLCYKDDYSAIDEQDVLKARKMFHVSPFLQRDGYYTFRFSYKNNKFFSLIDYFGDDHKKILSTSLSGALHDMTRTKLCHVILTYPFLTFKVLWLIHWQALKIFLKKIPYVPKPEKLDLSITQTEPLYPTNKNEE